MLRLVGHRLLSGAAGASEVTEAPAVYCHNVDRLCVCIKLVVIVSDRNTDSVTISKENMENQPTQIANNHIWSAQETTNTSSNGSIKLWKLSPPTFHMLNYSPKLFILLMNFLG